MDNILSLSDFAGGLGQGSPSQIIVGTGTSGPRGVESKWEYNDLQMNVHEWIDTYLINNINGIDDADIRDSREVNPSEHGETAFNAFYGGRTIVIQGKIRTFDLFKLRDMQQALRQAFAELVERPLIIRTNVINKDMFIECRKSQPIQMAEIQQTQNHFERDFQITLRASKPYFKSYIENVEIVDNLINGIPETRELTNLGNFQAQTEFIITGPLSAGTQIINNTPLNTQMVATLAEEITDEETCTLNSETKTFLDQDGNNVYHKLDVTSDPILLHADTINTIDIIPNHSLAWMANIQIKWRHTYI